MEALELLDLSAKIIESCNLDYWLEGGTLLGIVRENRILPWDNDLDLSLMYPGNEILENLINSFKNKGLRVKVRKFKSNTKPFKNSSVRIIKIRKKHFFGLKKGKVCLDLFIKYSKGGNAYWQIGDKIKSVPNKFYSSVKTIEFNNYTYLIPQLTNEYLTYRYGDWKKVNKDWNTFTDDKALN